MVNRNLVIISCLLLFSLGVFPKDKEKVHYSLSDIFALADQNSHQLKVSQVGIEKADRAVRVAKDGKLPVIESFFGGSYIGNQTLLSRGFADASSVATPHWGNAMTLEIKQSIYEGGSITGAITLGELESQLARLQHEQNKQEVRFTLSSWYLSLCRLCNEEKIYLSSKHQAEQLLKQMRACFEQGTVLKSDVTRYRLYLKDIEIELEKIQNQQTTLNYYLLTVTGLPSHIKIQPDESHPHAEAKVTGDTEWQQEVNLNSFRIKTARKEEAIFFQQTENARSAKRPSIYLWASESLQGPIVSAMPPINKNLNNWQVGIGLRFTISSFYTANKKVRLHESAWRQSKENLQLTIDREQMEVNEAYLKWTESVNQLKVREEYKELADENYEVVSERYLNGLAIVTEMLDASTEQLSAELKLANKRIEIYYNYSRLKKLAGLL